MIQTVLLLAIVGLLVAHFWRPNAELEAFESTAPYDDCTPTTGPAVELPQDDPRDLPWIASWSPADRYARTGHNCRVLFTESGPSGTQILTVPKTCEDGMAHTRVGDRIVIPDSIPEALRSQTIAHELIHIYQRRHPAQWRAFYHAQWRFELYTEPPADMPASVVGARRGNPDTWDPVMGGPWACWMGRWWPVCVYRDPQQPALRDAVMVWWDNTLKQLSRTPPPEWITFFGRPAQEEHPHEIAAVYLADGDTSTEAGRRAVIWFRGKEPFFSAHPIEPRLP